MISSSLVSMFNIVATNLYGQSMPHSAPKMNPFEQQIMIHRGLGFGYSCLSQHTPSVRQQWDLRSTSYRSCIQKHRRESE